MNTGLLFPSSNCLSVPYAIACQRSETYGTLQEERLQDITLDHLAANHAIHRLFAAQGFPEDPVRDDLRWRRDPLGKPYVEWEGEVEAWALENDRTCHHLHVSNTHDGGMHLVIAAYDPRLVGIGIDLVWLPRLRMAGKDSSYLHRFASRFMSSEEKTAFVEHAEENDEEALRVRVAAHFSLMEAASKACGTGLKIGVGMGKATSLPKQSLGVRRLAPEVELLFGPEAQARLDGLSAVEYQACWHADSDHLVSVVALLKEEGERTRFLSVNGMG